MRCKHCLLKEKSSYIFCTWLIAHFSRIGSQYRLQQVSLPSITHVWRSHQLITDIQLPIQRCSTSVVVNYAYCRTFRRVFRHLFHVTAAAVAALVDTVGGGRRAWIRHVRVGLRLIWLNLTSCWWKQWRNYNFWAPGKHSLQALVHLWTANASSNRQSTALQNVSVYRVRHTNSEMLITTLAHALIDRSGTVNKVGRDDDFVKYRYIV